MCAFTTIIHFLVGLDDGITLAFDFGLFIDSFMIVVWLVD